MSGNQRIVLPKDLGKLRERASRAISPIKPALDPAGRDLQFLLDARRTEAGRGLPPYYMVYFLLIDLLNFPDMGRWEKVDWRIPIDFEGQTFTIEYRKFGIGVFAPQPEKEEERARRIVGLIRRGVSVAGPYFEWLAAKAVQESKLNVTSHSGWLFERYYYLRGRFDECEAEAERRKDERHEEKQTLKDGTVVTAVIMPCYELKQNARWMGLAAIDAFFSWTEHLFIHLAILQSRVTTGDQVAALAGAEWPDKFKTAMDLGDPATQPFFDQLLMIRRQLRNFVAHGAFGKRGEAFRFHSRAGAVPVLMTRTVRKARFSMIGEPAFDERAALQVIDAFIEHLWSGKRAPARVYLEDSALPTILPMATDGTYDTAMNSVEDMRDLVERLTWSLDNAANMDW